METIKINKADVDGLVEVTEKNRSVKSYRVKSQVLLKVEIYDGNNNVEGYIGFYDKNDKVDVVTYDKNLFLLSVKKVSKKKWSELCNILFNLAF